MVRPVRPVRGAGIELVLEDDRGRFAIDPASVGVSLGPAGWTAGAAPLHRAEALLREVAAEPLVPQGNCEADERFQLGDPGARDLGLAPFVPGCMERQPDDELVSALLRRDSGDGCCVQGGRRPPKGDERNCPPAIAISHRQPDPPLPQIRPENPRHGAALASGETPPEGAGAP